MTIDGYTVEEFSARFDAAIRALSALLALVDKTGGYTTHAQQAAIREARAVLAEAGEP